MTGDRTLPATGCDGQYCSNCPDQQVCRETEPGKIDALRARLADTERDKMIIDFCPQCGKRTLEIQAQAFTSDGRPYGLEHCSNCD